MSKYHCVDVCILLHPDTSPVRPHIHKSLDSWEMYITFFLRSPASIPSCLLNSDFIKCPKLTLTWQQQWNMPISFLGFPLDQKKQSVYHNYANA